MANSWLATKVCWDRCASFFHTRGQRPTYRFGSLKELRMPVVCDADFTRVVERVARALPFAASASGLATSPITIPQWMQLQA